MLRAHPDADDLGRAVAFVEDPSDAHRISVEEGQEQPRRRRAACTLAPAILSELKGVAQRGAERSGGVRERLQPYLAQHAPVVFGDRPDGVGNPAVSGQA
jgi:hypothetical protein